MNFGKSSIAVSCRIHGETGPATAEPDAGPAGSRRRCRAMSVHMDGKPLNWRRRRSFARIGNDKLLHLTSIWQVYRPPCICAKADRLSNVTQASRSEEHTSELQS